MKILKKYFDYEVVNACDTHHWVVINRAMFDACTSSSFRGVKSDTQTEIELHYMIQIR